MSAEHNTPAPAGRQLRVTGLRGNPSRVVLSNGQEATITQKLIDAFATPSPFDHVNFCGWRDKWHPQYASLAHAISAASQDLIVSADLVRNKTVGKRLQEHADLLGRIASDLIGNTTPAPADHLEGEVARLKADRNLFAGKYRSIIVLMDDTRQKVQEVVDHIQDEGDRTFFGSTNHADWLRDLVEDMDGWSFDAMLPKGDINKMERDPYADCRQLRTALKLAIEHIEHMAAFITPLKAGYSFESLGEDMPEIKAALSPSKSEPQS